MTRRTRIPAAFAEPYGWKSLENGDISLVFRRRFSVRDAWRVVHDDFSESGCALYLVVIGALMNYLLVRWFGDPSLAVLAIVVMVYELLLYLDGIPNASRALVGVYAAEGNFPAVRDLAREGLLWSFSLGSAVGVLLLAFPSLPVRILGVDADSAVWGTCLVAVRLVGASCFFHGILLYYISYLLFIGRSGMSLALSLLSQNLLPVIGFVFGGWLFGEIGFWTGYAMAETPSFTYDEYVRTRRMFDGVGSPAPSTVVSSGMNPGAVSLFAKRAIAELSGEEPTDFAAAARKLGVASVDITDIDDTELSVPREPFVVYSTSARRTVRSSS